jgi:hypothetical protein
LSLPDVLTNGAHRLERIDGADLNLEYRFPAGAKSLLNASCRVIITGIKIGDDDEVPRRISGHDTQVIEESLLDRSLAPAPEAK